MTISSGASQSATDRFTPIRGEDDTEPAQAGAVINGSSMTTASAAALVPRRLLGAGGYQAAYTCQEPPDQPERCRDDASDHRVLSSVTPALD